jgi:hypothetical protein
MPNAAPLRSRVKAKVLQLLVLKSVDCLAKNDVSDILHGDPTRLAKPVCNAECSEGGTGRPNHQADRPLPQSEHQKREETNRRPSNPYGLLGDAIAIRLWDHRLCLRMRFELEPRKPAFRQRYRETVRCSKTGTF